MLLRRAKAALARLAALPSPSLAFVFSYGQFIQAVRAIVTEAELDDQAKMRRFINVRARSLHAAERWDKLAAKAERAKAGAAL